MNKLAAIDALRERGYDNRTAVHAITAAATDGSSGYLLSRHRVQYLSGGSYEIIPVPWTQAAVVKDGNAPPDRENQVPLPAGGWAEVKSILHDIEVVDAHLDAAAPEIYRGDHPASKLANRWRRIGAGPASEGIESLDALNLATGGNPRKGVQGDDGTICGELGDTAVSALLAIQSITKDTTATWQVFLAALDKAYSRVPEDQR